MNNNIDCTVKGYDNLRMIMYWDMNQHSLDVENGKLVYKTLPRINVLDSNAVRRVSQLVLEILENLHKVVLRSTCELMASDPEVDLADCADSIEIFLTFMLASGPRLHKIVDNAEAEDKNRGLFSLSRTELPKIRAILQKVWDCEGIPKSVSFTPHVGKNTSGLIISQTVLCDGAGEPVKHIYRVQADSRISSCSSAFLSYEVHHFPYKVREGEVGFTAVSQVGPLLKVIQMPLKCNDRIKSHDCPVAKACGVMKQVYGELQPSTVVILRDDRPLEEFVNEMMHARNPETNHLRRKHPFFKG